MESRPLIEVGFFVIQRGANALRLPSRYMAKFIDFATLIRPVSPNTYLLAPEGICAKAEADSAPPEYNLSANQLYETLVETIKSRSSWRIKSQNVEELRIHFIAISSFLRFKDDIDVQIVPLSDSSATIAIYSRSRVGYSDFGANAKRVSNLVELLNKHTNRT